MGLAVFLGGGSPYKPLLEAGTLRCPLFNCSILKNVIWGLFAYFFKEKLTVWGGRRGGGIGQLDGFWIPDPTLTCLCDVDGGAE